jgi:hypothetical protein
MFNRLAAARAKSAEKSLAQGRLEEALEIASAPDLSDQRRIKQLMDRLVRAFLERGQERLLNRQFADALADFDRAARGGATSAALDEWRDRARRAMRDDQKMQGQKQAALTEARQKLAAGSIAGAVDAVAKSPVRDSDGAAMEGEIERQRLRAEAALRAANSCLGDGHVLEAARHLATARACHEKLEGIADVEADLLNKVLARARESFSEGRLDRARQELAALDRIGRTRPERVEMEDALRLAHEASEALTEDRYAKAGVLLGRLAQLGIPAGWIADVRKQLDGIDMQRRSLLEGPLGLMLGGSLPGAIEANSLTEATKVSPVRAMVAPPVVAGAVVADGDGLGGLLPRRLMLRIDGVGSFLLLRGERISIGRGGPGASADLQLISDLSERQAEIVRAGEDYFVASAAGVELAGRAVEHALLQDGDRIRLGQRVRLKFLRSSLKSPTAALELGEGVRMADDCRRVILWAGPLLLGGTRECHVPVRGIDSMVVLVERNGKMQLRQMGPHGLTVALALGAQTDFGELRLSVQEAARGSGMGRVVG